MWYETCNESTQYEKPKAIFMALVKTHRKLGTPAENCIYSKTTSD